MQSSRTLTDTIFAEMMASRKLCFRVSDKVCRTSHAGIFQTSELIRCLEKQTKEFVSGGELMSNN